MILSFIIMMLCRLLYIKGDKMFSDSSRYQATEWMDKMKISERFLSTNSSPTDCYSSFLVNLLLQLRWRLVIVIYDKYNDHLVHDITMQLSRAHQGIAVELHRMHDSDTSLSFLTDVHQRLFPRLDFLLLTSGTKVWEILSHVNGIDPGSRRTTDFNHHSKWLATLNSRTLDHSVYRLDNLHNVAFVKAAHRGQMCSIYTTLLTLVHHGKTTSLQRVLYDSHLNNSVLFPALQYGYNRRKITVSLTPASAFILTSTKNNITEYTGFCIYLLDALANALNFTYALVEPQHGTWGVLVNGSWSGLVGQMERREADLALADITININRSKVMDFLLPPIYYDFADIIYKEESSMPSTWLTFLRPFSANVFTWIGVSSVGFFVLYSAAVVLIRSRRPSRREPRTVTGVLWFTVSSLFKQGSSINPATHGVRVLVSAWLLFILIVVAEYTANLTAAFTVRPGIKPFESLRELLDNPQYKIGIFRGSITTMLLKNSDNPEYRETWAKILQDTQDDPEVLSNNMTVQLKKILGGDYAFIRNDGGLRSYMRENCGLQRLGISLNWQPVCLGVPKNSTLKLNLAQTMRRLETSGIFQYWWYVHQSNLKNPMCPSRQRSVSSSISLDDIKSGFVLLGAGVGLAAVCLVVELLRKKCTRD